jgi:hypothetical protein
LVSGSSFTGLASWEPVVDWGQASQ